MVLQASTLWNWVSSILNSFMKFFQVRLIKKATLSNIPYFLLLGKFICLCEDKISLCTIQSRDLLCSPGWLLTHNPPTSASQVWRLYASHPMGFSREWKIRVLIKQCLESQVSDFTAYHHSLIIVLFSLFLCCIMRCVT